MAKGKTSSQKRATVASLRKEYESAKRAYHRTGKAALGKRDNSAEQKAYAAAKRHYRQVGRELGKLTGVI